MSTSAAAVQDSFRVDEREVELPRVVDGKYRLETRLGEGATGSVYRAVHLDLRRPFALKLARRAADDGDRSIARFRREAEALGRLRHPAIVDVTNFGLDRGEGVRPYLVMELLQGETLADLSRREGALPLDRALALLSPVADAIDAAHEAGILHRDLKPQNVFLCRPAGGPPVVKVLDFGHAELLGGAPESARNAPEVTDDAAVPADASRLTETGALLGTPLYMAPELVRGEAASRASDLYSLGVLAYELLGGEPPFRGSTKDVLDAHRKTPPAPPSPGGTRLHDGVWTALKAALAKEPTDRPSSARGFVLRLEEARRRVRLEEWRRRELPRRVGISAALALALLVLSAARGHAGIPPLERLATDLRFRMAPRRAPDPRVLLVTVDSGGFAPGLTSLADGAEEAGRRLSRVFDAGAAGVAIDLRPPRKWASSPAFSRLLLSHPESTTLAAFANTEGEVLGTECVEGLTTAALGPGRAGRLFGLVNVDPDPDGISRRIRLVQRDRSGALRAAFALRAAGTVAGTSSLRLDPGRLEWIDHRIASDRYDAIPWLRLGEELERNPERFRGRLVLVGADLVASGEDSFRIPGRRGEVSGLTLQALAADTVLAGLPVRDVPAWPVALGAAFVTGLASAGILCRRRSGPPAALLGGTFALFLGAITLLFLFLAQVWPVSDFALTAFAGTTVAFGIRKTLPRHPDRVVR